METTTTGYGQMSDDELDARDERVRKAVVARMDELASEASEMRREAQMLEARASFLREAVLKGHFWELRHLISAEDVETLCECHPADLSDLLERQ